MAMWRGMQEITVRALGRQARHERVGHLHKERERIQAELICSIPESMLWIMIFKSHGVRPGA